MKLWRCAAGVSTLELWSSEGVRRCRDVEEVASRGLEMRRRRVASKRYGDPEIWRRAARVGTCRRQRYGALEAARGGEFESGDVCLEV